MLYENLVLLVTKRRGSLMSFAAIRNQKAAHPPVSSFQMEGRPK
jgi:hypothetical protein